MLTRYGVKLGLHDPNVAMYKDELTVSPKQSDYQRYPVRYKLYLQTKNNLYVPRFFKRWTTPAWPSDVMCERIQIINNIQFIGTLRDNTCQNEASERVISSLNMKGGCVLNLPTGYGKTTVALHVLSVMKVKTLIIVHKEFLMEQWHRKIIEFIPDCKIGKIQGGIVDTENKDVVLGMLQSLSMKSYDVNTFDTFGMTIIDEAHHVCSQTFSNIFKKFNTKYILGLSATLERSDGLTNVLHWYLGDIGFTTSRKEQHHVYVNVMPYTNPLYSTPFPKNNNGNTNLPLAITQLVELADRNDMIMAKLYELYATGRKIIVLTDRRIHCEMLYERTKSELGVSEVGLYIGGMKSEELQQSETKRIIIATYTLAHEGLDIPTLDTVMLITPKSNIVQAVGRILRETLGKKNNPLIIDILDKWGPFYSQYKKRESYYLQTGFNIDGYTQETVMFLEEGAL